MTDSYKAEDLTIVSNTLSHIERCRLAGTSLPEGMQNFALVFIVLMSLIATPAIAEEAKPPAGGGTGQSAAEVGKKLADPLSDVWALFTEFNHTWSDGDLTDGGHEEGTHMIFQPIMSLRLTENYKLLMRPTLPYNFSQDLPDGLRLNANQSPDDTTEFVSIGGVKFSSESGLGDMSLPLLVSPDPKPGEKWGFRGRGSGLES